VSERSDGLVKRKQVARGTWLVTLLAD